MEENQIGGSNGKRRRIDWSLKPCSYGYDRFTALPDEPLTRILGNLPTKDAAAISLVSKNVLHAFAYLTNFEFDDSPISHCRYGGPRHVERTPHFKDFVDNVLRASQSTQLDRFTLRFGRFCGDNKRVATQDYCTCWQSLCYPDLEPARVNAWVSFPLARRVRELDLCINVANGTLPRSIFVCETLEILKLDSNLDLDVDNNDDVKAFPIRLPRLKLLHLRTIHFKEDQFVTKLVESCTVLEDLLLACWWKCADVFAISSPSLLKLDLTLEKSSVPEAEKSSSDVIIQTPNLQSFKYWDNLAQHYSFPDMNALVKADIAIIWALVEDDCSKLCSILKSCSAVSHLTLQAICLRVLNSVELKNNLPVFLNLNHLELVYDFDYVPWNIVLVEFLKRSPSLQTLDFPQGLVDLPQLGGFSREFELERQFWRTTQASPSCCKSHLKRIVIKKFNGLPHELGLIQFLLEKALVLESVDISLSKPMRTPSRGIALPMHHPVDFQSVQSALREMPRASKFCSIRVTCD